MRSLLAAGFGHTRDKRFGRVLPPLASGCEALHYSVLRLHDGAFALPPEHPGAFGESSCGPFSTEKPVPMNSEARPLPTFKCASSHKAATFETAFVSPVEHRQAMRRRDMHHRPAVYLVPPPQLGSIRLQAGALLPPSPRCLESGRANHGAANRDTCAPC